MLHMEERETELEGMVSLGTFDKGRLVAVIDRVLVYSEERIEIVWKMDDWFFPEAEPYDIRSMLFRHERHIKNRYLIS